MNLTTYVVCRRGGKKLKTTSGGLIARTDDRFGGGGGTSWSHLIMILQKEYGFVDDSLFGGDADEMFVHIFCSFFFQCGQLGPLFRLWYKNMLTKSFCLETIWLKTINNTFSNVSQVAGK